MKIKSLFGIVCSGMSLCLLISTSFDGCKKSVTQDLIPFQIHGTITDINTGLPIAGATVVLGVRGSNADTKRRVQSNDNGQYSITYEGPCNVRMIGPSARLAVWAEIDGYFSGSTQIQCSKSSQIINLQLKKTAL